MKKHPINIDFIVEKLSYYPHIRFEKIGKNELILVKNDPHGFDIRLFIEHPENTLFFGDTHTHFGHSEDEYEEMGRFMLLGLTKAVRVKVFSKSGKPYKWTLQTQSEEGEWFDYSTSRLLIFNFWAKTTVHYLQNNILTEDLLFAQR